MRLEPWGTSNLFKNGQPEPGDVSWQAMEQDLAIAPNQWVLLAQWGPGAQRRYQWYRVASASPNTIEGPVDTTPFDRGGYGGFYSPSREVLLVGPDWDPVGNGLYDTYVYMMNNVVSVYERTITVPSNSFPRPQIHPWSLGP